MKSFLVIIISLFFNFAFCQSNKQLHSIEPKWKLGDIKKVQTESFTKVYIKDSLFNNTEAKANYLIKVIDTTKNYTILYSSLPNSLDIKSNSSIAKVDSVIEFFSTIAKRIENETKAFEYEILVDKNTGQALKIKNTDKLIKLIESISSSTIEEFGVKFGKTNSQIDSAKQKLVSVFKLKGPKIIETILNEYNYIMTAYSLEFPYNSSVSQKAMVHDVNAMGDFGDIEMPAIITTSSKKQNNSLTVHTDTDYDKDFLLTQIKKKYKNMKDLTTSDIFLSEKTTTLFTTVSNWIVYQKSNVIFKTKEVKVINETQVNFQ